MEKQEHQKHKETADFHNINSIEIQESLDFEKYIKISNLWVSAMIDQRAMELTNKTQIKSILEIPEAFSETDNPIGRILHEAGCNHVNYTLLN